MDTTLIQVGPIAVHRFGLALGLAFLAAGFLGSRMAARHGVASGDWWRLVVWVMAASVIGARLGFFVTDWSRLVQIDQWRFPVSGLSWFGGLVCALAVVIWAGRRMDISFWPFVDIMTPALIAGQIVMGVFWTTPVIHAALSATAAAFLHIIYITGWYVLLWWLWLRQRDQAFPGELGLTYLTGEGALRFVLFSIASLYSPGGWIGSGWTHLFHLLVVGLGVALFRSRAREHSAEMEVPHALKRPFTRWLGWLIAYGFLMAVMIVVQR